MVKKFCAILDGSSGTFSHEVVELPPNQDETEAIEEVLDVRSLDQWQVLDVSEENAVALEKAARAMRKLLAIKVKKHRS